MGTLEEARRKYESRSDREMLLLTAQKLDTVTENLEAFMLARYKTQEKHECRMDGLDEMMDEHDKRLNTLETYFKVLVGTGILAFSAFGLYIVQLIVGD